MLKLSFAKSRELDRLTTFSMVGGWLGGWCRRIDYRDYRGLCRFYTGVCNTLLDYTVLYKSIHDYIGLYQL